MLSERDRCRGSVSFAIVVVVVVVAAVVVVVVVVRSAPLTPSHVVEVVIAVAVAVTFAIVAIAVACGRFRCLRPKPFTEDSYCLLFSRCSPGCGSCVCCPLGDIFPNKGRLEGLAPKPGIDPVIESQAISISIYISISIGDNSCRCRCIHTCTPLVGRKVVRHCPLGVQDQSADELVILNGIQVRHTARVRVRVSVDHFLRILLLLYHHQRLRRI
mmetsp:Transcript_7578/g.22175  ORF Transcript_7578/g.22175 Transcript_7578/m.22175 type:complete len:215 (-) Transcript_7578:1233-1877(-)